MSASDYRQDDWVGIGHDHSIQRRYFKGELSGVAYRHKRPDGTACEGWITIKGSKWGSAFDNEGWELISIDPLTVSPSLLCRVCGDHGFIRDGKWVPA